MIEIKTNPYGASCYIKCDDSGNHYLLRFEMNKQWSDVDKEELEESFDAIYEELKQKIAELIL